MSQTDPWGRRGVACWSPHTSVERIMNNWIGGQGVCWRLMMAEEVHESNINKSIRPLLILLLINRGSTSRFYSLSVSVTHYNQGQKVSELMLSVNDAFIKELVYTWNKYTASVHHDSDRSIFIMQNGILISMFRAHVTGLNRERTLRCQCPCISQKNTYCGHGEYFILQTVYVHVPIWLTGWLDGWLLSQLLSLLHRLFFISTFFGDSKLLDCCRVSYM